jgi:hypothetical protein
MKHLLRLLVFAPLVSLCLGAASVSFSEEPGKIQVVVAGQPFTTLHFSADLDKPFFHPFRTASGAVVTRGWPLDPAPGDTKDHPHQRGLWWAHGMTNKVDFWTNVKGTGRYRLKSPPAVDRDKGSIRLNLEMVAPDDRVLGSLIEEYTFSAAGDTRLVDVVIRILADRDSAIVLGDTKEGVLGFRMAEDLTEPKGAVLTNSEGGVGEKQIWGKRANWVDYSGKVAGTAAGVAMFDHPSNPNFPTYWMARGYGLLAANATGAREFSGDQKLDGTITIPQGGKIEFRHLLVIHPGDAKTAGIEALYRSFAAK